MGKFQIITRRDKKTFLSEQCKEIEENNRMVGGGDPVEWERLEIIEILEIPKEHFMQRWA